MVKGKKYKNLLDTAVLNPQITWPVRKTITLAQCLRTLTRRPALLRLAGTCTSGQGSRKGEGRAGPVPTCLGSTAGCSWAKRQQSVYSKNHKSTKFQGLSTASFLESPASPSGPLTNSHSQSKQITLQPATKASEPVFTLTQQRASAPPEIQ